MSRHNKRKSSVGSFNFSSMIIIALSAMVVVWFLSDSVYTQVNKKKDNNNAKTEETVISNNKTTLSLEDIVSNELNEVVSGNDTVEKDTENNGIDYSNLTITELVKQGTEKVEEDSILAKDMAIKYTESTYKGVTKDGAFVLNVNGEDKYFYPIGVNITDAQSIANAMVGADKVYIEYDISTKKGQVEQAYLWLVPPDNNAKDSMINMLILQSGWGTYVDPMPNIKYQYYFLKLNEQPTA